MLPREFEERLKIQLGDEFEAYLAAISEERYRALRVNTQKCSKEAFLEMNPWGIEAADKVEWCEAGYYYRKEDELSPGRHPYHAAGVYYIQEPSAMSPVPYLDVRENMKVLDLCASPGGKTTQIASYMKQSGILVANEPNPLRAEVLSENIERMGIANALVISHSPASISERFAGYFDRILVDAPCSGEGMFRKNENAASEWSPDNVFLCSEVQKSILEEAFIMLKPGGRLVYSTCTFSEEENEENMTWFTEEYKEMKLLLTKRLWPHRDKGEGHFLAVLEKSGKGEEPKIKLQKGIDLKTAGLYFEFAKEFFTKDTKSIFPDGYETYTLFGDELYLLPKEFPDMKGLKVLRSGIHLGTLKKNRFEPSFALSHYLKADDAVRVMNLDVKSAVKYLKGETLSLEGDKGWYLICIDSFPLGFGKLSQGIMKNHYPKGLRIKQ